MRKGGMNGVVRSGEWGLHSWPRAVQLRGLCVDGLVAAEDRREEIARPPICG